MAKRTIKVRIALAVDINGKWQAAGGTWLEKESDSGIFDEAYIDDDLAEPAQRYFVTAEIELPLGWEPKIAKGVVEKVPDAEF